MGRVPAVTIVDEGHGGRSPRGLCQLPERLDLRCRWLAFVGTSWIERVVAWWALSGAAVLMDRATRDPFEIETKERSS